MDGNPYAAPRVETTPNRVQGTFGPQEWSVSGALRIGWDAVWRHPGVLIFGFLAVLVIQQIIAQTAKQLFLSQSGVVGPFAEAISALATLPLAIIVGAYLSIGQFRVALAAARGEPVEFGMFFSGMNRLLTGILLLIVLYAGISLGFLFLIVPGVILALGWSLTIPLLADTNLGVVELVSESWEMMNGQKGALLLFSFACAFVMVLSVLALVVGFFVALPMIMVAFAEVYMCITGRRQSES